MASLPILNDTKPSKCVVYNNKKKKTSHTTDIEISQHKIELNVHVYNWGLRVFNSDDHFSKLRQHARLLLRADDKKFKRLKELTIEQVCDDIVNYSDYYVFMSAIVTDPYMDILSKLFLGRSFMKIFVKDLETSKQKTLKEFMVPLLFDIIDSKEDPSTLVKILRALERTEKFIVFIHVPKLTHLDEFQNMIKFMSI